jgi:hypothetical protein
VVERDPSPGDEGQLPIDRIRLDRTAVRVVPLGREPPDGAYWLSRPVEERWQAVELAREMAYGRDVTTARLQRILAIVPLAGS